jgi:hypothetical protein
MKTKHYKVTGQFIIDFSKIVSAKSEAEAKRKARDSCVKNMKIKKSQLNKDDVSIWEID